jgi:hypothetical protein
LVLDDQALDNLPDNARSSSDNGSGYIAEKTMRYDSRELDSLEFDNVVARLQRGIDGLVLVNIASIPEADVLCCRYKGKRLNVTFDLNYGVCIETIDDLSNNEIKEIVVLIK